MDERLGMEIVPEYLIFHYNFCMQLLVKPVTYAQLMFYQVIVCKSFLTIFVENFIFVLILQNGYKL